MRFRDFSPLITLHRTKFSSPNLEVISIEEDPGSNYPSFILETNMKRVEIVLPVIDYSSSQADPHKYRNKRS